VEPCGGGSFPSEYQDEQRVAQVLRDADAMHIQLEGFLAKWQDQEVTWESGAALSAEIYFQCIVCRTEIVRDRYLFCDGCAAPMHVWCAWRCERCHDFYCPPHADPRTHPCVP